MADQRLSGKTAVITGGCDGIGRAAVSRFIECGARVVVADIQEEKGYELEREFGGQAKFYRCDINEEHDWEGIVEHAVSHFGGLDVMYHNAAAPVTKNQIHEMDRVEWDSAVSLLLTASVLAIKVAVPAMKVRGGGSIILTSSTSAYSLQQAYSTAYPVLKGAVTALGQVAALKYAPDRIRVNTLVPGGVASPLHLKTAGYEQDRADLIWPHYKELLFSRFQPLPIAGEPTDIANAAVFLASEEARWITGVDLRVDGGLTLERPLGGDGHAQQQALREAEQRAFPPDAGDRLSQRP